MKPILRAAVAAIALSVAPSCLFAHVRNPLDTDLAVTTLGAKTGRSSNHSILWLVAWGDAGAKAAAQEGGITTLRQMDVEVLFIFFGLYVQQTTIVYGD